MRWSIPATCTTTCGCTGEEDPGVVEHTRARLQDHALSQQQVLSRRPRPELVRQRGLGLRPARPWLDRTPDLRKGPLHVSERTGTQGEAQTIHRESREEDRRFGLT